MLGAPDLVALPAQVGGGLIPTGTRVDVFQRIFWVFLVLGTLVGVVVVGYMLYSAYKYRDRPEREELEDPPRLGEIPTGGGKGRKLFLSFTLSAIIVISLILWTYGTLLFVETQAVAAGESTVAAVDYEPGDEEITIHVTGYQFGWRYEYPNGKTFDSATGAPMRVPKGTQVNLVVTSADVFHNFWIPAQRAKADAITGHNTTTWFTANEVGEYTARCAELCGAGHSYMTATVKVMEQDEFNQWYANTTDQ